MGEQVAGRRGREARGIENAHNRSDAGGIHGISGKEQGAGRREPKKRKGG